MALKVRTLDKVSKMDGALRSNVLHPEVVKHLLPCRQKVLPIHELADGSTIFPTTFLSELIAFHLNQVFGQSSVKYVLWRLPTVC